MSNYSIDGLAAILLSDLRNLHGEVKAKSILARALRHAEWNPHDVCKSRGHCNYVPMCVFGKEVAARKAARFIPTPEEMDEYDNDMDRKTLEF